MKPEPFLIFFPPRILEPDFTKGDHNEILDDAKDRYLDDGSVLVDEDGLKEAQKIVAFAEAFPRVVHFDAE